MRGDVPVVIPAQESLTVEFKSDRKRLPDAELPIDSLIALGALRELKRLTAEELAERIQRAEAMGLCRLSEWQAKNLLKRMSAAGAIVLHGMGKGAFCMLGASQTG